MRIIRNQEYFQRIIEQSLIVEPNSYEVRVTETNLVVLTGWFDLESMAHAILAIKPLYLDGDNWLHKGVSSTDECHSLTNSKMIELRNNLIGMGSPHPCQADSGNGAHLMLAALLSNSPDDRALVEEYFKAVPTRFGVPYKHGEKIKPRTPGYEDMIINIDAAVFNPGRTVSAYGAMKRKGKDIPRRPHRLSCILDSPEQLEIVERGLIPRVEADLALKNTTTVVMVATEQSPPGEATLRDQHQESWSDGFGSIDTDELWVHGGDEPLRPIAGFDLAAQLGAMGVLAGEPKIAEKFTYYPVKECPFNSQHKKVVLSQHRSGAITYLCPHFSCKGKKQGFDRKTARDYFGHYGVMIPVGSWTGGVRQIESDPRSVTVEVISYEQDRREMPL
jgi:hypothetical protein